MRRKGGLEMERFTGVGFGKGRGKRGCDRRGEGQETGRRKGRKRAGDARRMRREREERSRIVGWEDEESEEVRRVEGSREVRG